MRDLNTAVHLRLHDEYCRCRDCKPPLAQVQALARLKVALIGSGVLVGLLLVPHL